MAPRISPVQIETEIVMSPLAAKKAAADARRIELAGRGTANVQPTSYFDPTMVQAESLLVALVADADWRNEIAQEATSANVIYVFSKRNLTVGEQPTFVRYGYSSAVEDVVLTLQGTALPTGFSLDGVKSHEIVAAEKANDKRKASMKASRKRDEAFARIGF
jgi:hypothetical protein